jgi:hypothetical protein
MSATKKFVINRKAAVAPEMSQALAVIEPVPAFVEELDESDDDDNDSVYSTCCTDCDKPFTFDDPVSADDYRFGRHELRCPECREGEPEVKPDGSERFKTAFGREHTEIERSILNFCEWIVTTKDIAKHLKPIYPDITKTAINSLLYKAHTKGLVNKLEKKDGSAPSWCLRE